MDRYRIGIVIPAYNESKTITGVVAKVKKYGIPIVVDDGSSDNTSELAVESGGEVVKHDVNRGYDKALESGFVKAAECGCDFVITIDADGQHNPEVLNSFIKGLVDGADVVIGIRNSRQRLAEHIFSWVSTIKWGISDPLCGLKAYRISVFRTLGHFDSYDSIGTELAIFACKSGMNILQIPIRIRDRLDKPRFGSRFSSNIIIIRALWYGLKLKVS